MKRKTYHKYLTHICFICVMLSFILGVQNIFAGSIEDIKGEQQIYTWQEFLKQNEVRKSGFESNLNETNSNSSSDDSNQPSSSEGISDNQVVETNLKTSNEANEKKNDSKTKKVSVVDVLKDQEHFWTIITCILGSSLLGALFNFLVYGKQLKRELYIKRSDISAEVIENSILQFRNLVDELAVWEMLDVNGRIEEETYELDFFNPSDLYPAIFNGDVQLQEFGDKLYEFKSKYEKNLPLQLRLESVFLFKYYMQLIRYVSSFYHPAVLAQWGANFYVEINKWTTKTDVKIVKYLNKKEFKFSYSSGKKYSFWRKILVEKRWEKSDLYTCINSKYVPRSEEELIEELQNITDKSHKEGLILLRDATIYKYQQLMLAEEMNKGTN